MIGYSNLLYDIFSYIVVCYVMLKYISLYHNVLYSNFIKLRKVASSIILPAKTEPIWTLSEPVIKTLCLQMGGGCDPPPTPPCFQEHPTMNKTCIKQETVLELFKTHHKGSLFAEGGCVLVSHYTML